MIETKPTEVLRVDADGKEVLIYRDEFKRIPALYDAVTSYDKLCEELAMVEYEKEKLLHAKFSMTARLNSEANNYVKMRDGDEPESED